MELAGIYFTLWTLAVIWAVSIVVTFFFGAYCEAKRHGLVK